MFCNLLVYNHVASRSNTIINASTNCHVIDIVPYRVAIIIVVYIVI